MMNDVLLFVVGLCVGVMNAVAGGGGIVGFPALIAFGGLSPLVANATYNVVNSISQLASAYGYRQYIRATPKAYLILLIPCILGSIVGALLLRQTSQQDFNHLIPWLLLGAVVLFAVQPRLQRQLQRTMRIKRPVNPLLVIAIILLPVAVYGGYFGAGFGFIMLAFLGFTKLADMHQMNGLRNLSGVVIGLSCIAVLLPGEFIDWRSGLIMGVSSAMGGYVGARVTQRISSHTIRVVVILIGLVTAGYIAIDSL